MPARPLWLLVALLVVPLAGCLSGAPQAAPPEAARLDCTVACNIQATIEPERQANELSIAVNPTDPSNIVASGKDYLPAEAGDCVRDGIYVTHDGGRTWHNSNVPGSPWRLLSAPAGFQAHPELSRYWCVTDPVVAFAPDGTLYWTVMPYQCDALSGSKAGDGVHPQGGFNDWFWTCSSMYVLASDDGGRTWARIREVAFGPRLEHDKQWLSVAPDGTALLCWDRDPDYQAVGAVDNPGAQLSRPGYMVCSHSRDRGHTWSPVRDVNPPGDRVTGAGATWDGYLPWVDFGPDGTAWMAAIDSRGHVLVSSSRDLETWSAPAVVGTYQNPPPDGSFGWPALNGSVFRTFALPTLTVDRSDGPHGGTVYVAWMDHSTGDAEVLFTRSTDGTAWSTPVRLGTDDPEGAVDQFMPALSAGPDGTLDAVWYDRRYDPAGHLFDLMYAYSLDGGQTWSEDLRVSESSSDERYSHHQNGMVFLGDYIDIDSGHGKAHPVWVDTRNGKADAFVAVVERPPANGQASLQEGGGRAALVTGPGP